MLNNFKYWLETFMFNSIALQSSADGMAAGSLIHKVIATDGSNWGSYAKKNVLAQSMLGIVSTAINGEGTGIKLGTDDITETTDTSYKLGLDVTSNFTLKSPSNSVTFKDGKIQFTVSAIYENKTDQSITINEIGLTRTWGAYVGGSTTKTILLDRKSVADGNFTPVTVGAGESKIFVYAIEL